MKRKVVIGFVGTQLDAGKGSGRWEKWRPTVSLVQHEDILIDRIELLHTGSSPELLRQLAGDIGSVSPETRFNPVLVELKDPWDFEEVYAALFDFARAYPFNTDEEEYWVHITTGTHVVQICLFLLAETRYLPGVLLQTSPPRKQRYGEVGELALIDLDLSRYDAIAQRFAREKDDALNFLKSGIATRNPAFNRMVAEIERVAIRSQAPVLLTGPTGAGKSMLARRIYELRKTRGLLAGAFVEVNCAMLRGDGMASMLFGHVRGAYTGAANERAGLLKSADRGLLFLDEIGELSLDGQAMLLKAVEEKRFLPLGSDKEVESDFQLIAGTNRDLGAEVAAGQFRADLYARINLWTYQLPGIAERTEDIEPNIDYLLEKLSGASGERVGFNKEARSHYLSFAVSGQALWTGNFRDLSASVTRLFTLAESGRITRDVVDEEIARLGRLWKAEQVSGTGESGDILNDFFSAEELAGIDLFDRMQLASVITICRRAKNCSEAGRLLFAASRAARASNNDADRLRKYLSRFGLKWDDLH